VIKEKRVSIVTISFNQAEFVERTIRSVLSQKTGHVEYIVLDPGSVDGSQEIITKYAENIDQIIFEPDRGPADALNKGFARAKGEIIGYVNSDDVLYPGAVTAVTEFFGSNPDVDIVSGHCHIIDEGDRQLRRMFSDEFNVRAVAYRSCYLAQPATFFRRSLFLQSGGFNVENRVAWDGELWVDFAMSGAKFAVIDAILAGYRLHSKSITSRGVDERQKAYSSYIFRKIMQRPERNRDALFRTIYRANRLLKRPEALIETLRYGSINRQSFKGTFISKLFESLKRVRC
jgi:glycosyltransferase involved in cell wall biosynthesis